MRTEDALGACEETVRRHDPDRYFASLFAPVARRPFLFALYAFNYEIARVPERSREPMLGAVRLQWWREAVELAREGRPRAHPAAVGLAALFAQTSPPQTLFGALIEAREFDLVPDSFADLRALETYCDATSAGLMRIAAWVANGESGSDPFLRHAGSGYAMAGILRAIPFHAARRKCYLPLDMLAAEKLTPDEIFAGRNISSLKRVMDRLGRVAREHIRSARGEAAGTSLAAALPAALAPLYLKRVTRAAFDPFRDESAVPLFRRQLALLQAAMFGRL